MKLWRLEALRGLAAAYVVLHHSAPLGLVIAGVKIGILFRFGQEAVILFFLLSGFVINYSFRVTPDKRFATYFRKRFTRIYVPLVPVLGISYLLLANRAGNWIDPELPKLLGNLLMLQDTMKPQVIVYPYMGNEPLWSLSYEWWFYILYFPIASSLLDWQSRSRLVWLISFTAAVAYACDANPIFRILCYLGIWWAGVHVSELYCRNQANSFRYFIEPVSVLAAITAVLSAKVAYIQSIGETLSVGLHPVLEVRHFAFATLAILVAYLWRKANWWGFNQLVKPFSALAPISYALYISHFPMFSYASYLSFLHNEVMEKLLYGVVVVVFCWALEMRLYPAVNGYMRKRMRVVPS